MTAAAEVMDNPADLINVVIEELVRQRIVKLMEGRI